MAKKDITEQPKEKVSKVALDTQFEMAGLSDYDVLELIRMVNSTAGDKEFEKNYPTVAFSRNLAYTYLERKCGFVYLSHGIVIPKGMAMDEFLLAVERLCGTNESIATGSKTDAFSVPVAMNERKVRKTLSMNVGSMQRWEAFVEGLPNKSDFLSAAVDYFMQQFVAGKVKMEADFLSGTKK